MLFLWQKCALSGCRLAIDQKSLDIELNDGKLTVRYVCLAGHNGIWRSTRDQILYFSGKILVKNAAKIYKIIEID